MNKLLSHASLRCKETDAGLKAAEGHFNCSVMKVIPLQADPPEEGCGQHLLFSL